MSSRPLDFEPPASLTLDRDVSWTMKEPVLVVWPDNDSDAARTLSLGQPCYMNGYPNVTLWMGEDAEKKLAIVMLQMSFSIKISKRKKTFDIFLILPTNNLCVHSSSLMFESLPSNVHACLEGSLSEPGWRKLLHFGFVLDGASEVLMPRWPESARAVTGTPLHLMILLKSLSQMCKFDAYIAYSTYSAEALKSLRACFDNGVVRPNVNMDRAYGGAGGCYDRWRQFNAEYLSEKASLERVLTLSKTKHSSVFSNPGDVRDSPVARKRLRISSPQHPLAERSHTKRTTHSEPASQSYQDAIASNAGPPPPYGQPEKSPRQSPCGPVRSTSAAILIPESDSAPSPAYVSLDSGDYIPETPEHVMNEDVPVITSAHRSESDMVLRSSMISWILTMKTVDADFYKNMRLHRVLLSLGRAVLDQNRAQFIMAKAKGTTIVLAKAATLAGGCSLNTRPPNLLREMDLLTQWMYSLDLDADMATVSFLRKMALWAVAHRQHVRTQTASVEKAAGLEAEFRRHEAECIVEFYIRMSA